MLSCWESEGRCKSRKGPLLQLVAQRKKKMHTAMLRWHPDKFLAAFSGVLLGAERDAVLGEVTATAARLFAEMEHHRRRGSETG